MLSSVAFTGFLCGTAATTVTILARSATFAAGWCRRFKEITFPQQKCLYYMNKYYTISQFLTVSDSSGFDDEKEVH